MPSAIEDSLPWTAYGLIGVSAMMLAYVTMMDKSDGSDETDQNTEETQDEEPEPEPEPEPEDSEEGSGESIFSSITGAPESKKEENVKEGEEKPSFMEQAFATVTGEQPDEKKEKDNEKTGGKTKKSKKPTKGKKIKGGKNKTKKMKKIKGGLENSESPTCIPKHTSSFARIGIGISPDVKRAMQNILYGLHLIVKQIESPGNSFDESVTYGKNNYVTIRNKFDEYYTHISVSPPNDNLNNTITITDVVYQENADQNSNGNLIGTTKPPTNATTETNTPIFYKITNNESGSYMAENKFSKSQEDTYKKAIQKLISNNACKYLLQGIKLGKNDNIKIVLQLRYGEDMKVFENTKLSLPVKPSLIRKTADPLDVITKIYNEELNSLLFNTTLSPKELKQQENILKTDYDREIATARAEAKAKELRINQNEGHRIRPVA